MYLLGQVLQALQTVCGHFGDLVSIQVKLKQRARQTWTFLTQINVYRFIEVKGISAIIHNRDDSVPLGMAVMLVSAIRM